MTLHVKSPPVSGKAIAPEINPAFNLTDKSGNRLANSEGYARAASYAKDVLTKNGAVNASIEAWGEFGKGWDLEKMYFAMTAPYYKPLLAWPKTWTAGTNGLKNATILVVDAKDSVTLLTYKGQLKGKIIILDQENKYKQSFKADAVRYTDEDLAKMAAATPQAGGRRQPDCHPYRLHSLDHHACLSPFLRHPFPSGLSQF